MYISGSSGASDYFALLETQEVLDAIGEFVCYVICCMSLPTSGQESKYIKKRNPFMMMTISISQIVRVI